MRWEPATSIPAEQNGNIKETVNIIDAVIFDQFCSPSPGKIPKLPERLRAKVCGLS